MTRTGSAPAGRGARSPHRSKRKPRARRLSPGGPRVNDNPQGDATSQYLPVVDIAPNGRVDVGFLDRCHDPDDLEMDAYDFGTRMRLLSHRDSALIAWADSRLAQDPEHGRQDIFAARVALPGVGTHRMSTLTALVGLLGGLACLAGGIWLHRRAPRGRRG